MCENRCNLKIVQSMIRVNNKDLIRRSKKSEVCDLRHAGIDFFFDVHKIMQGYHREYWQSESTSIAFYESDMKNLDNLIKQMELFTQANLIQKLKLL